jgi:hypothetical protein
MGHALLWVGKWFALFLAENGLKRGLTVNIDR